MTAKKCTKKRDGRAELLFYQSKPIAFMPFSLTSPSSLLELSIAFRLENCPPTPPLNPTVWEEWVTGWLGSLPKSSTYRINNSPPQGSHDQPSVRNPPPPPPHLRLNMCKAPSILRNYLETKQESKEISYRQPMSLRLASFNCQAPLVS